MQFDQGLQLYPSTLMFGQRHDKTISNRYESSLSWRNRGEVALRQGF